MNLTFSSAPIFSTRDCSYRWVLSQTNSVSFWIIGEPHGNQAHTFVNHFYNQFKKNIPDDSSIAVENDWILKIKAKQIKTVFSFELKESIYKVLSRKATNSFSSK
jgi:hypothetical protein